MIRDLLVGWAEGFCDDFLLPPGGGGGCGRVQSLQLIEEPFWSNAKTEASLQWRIMRGISVKRD